MHPYYISVSLGFSQIAIEILNEGTICENSIMYLLSY